LTGAWAVNYTWVNPTNATMNYTQVNLTNGNTFGMFGAIIPIVMQHFSFK